MKESLDVLKSDTEALVATDPSEIERVFKLFYLLCRLRRNVRIFVRVLKRTRYSYHWTLTHSFPQPTSLLMNVMDMFECIVISHM